MTFWINLFKNDRKTEGDNQPLYKNAKMMVENDVTLTAGIPYEVALWTKDQTKDGKPVQMVSIKIEPNQFLINEGAVKVEQTDKPPF